MSERAHIVQASKVEPMGAGDAAVVEIMRKERLRCECY